MVSIFLTYDWWLYIYIYYIKPVGWAGLSPSKKKNVHKFIRDSQNSNTKPPPSRWLIFWKKIIYPPSWNMIIFGGVFLYPKDPKTSGEGRSASGWTFAPWHLKVGVTPIYSLRIPIPYPVLFMEDNPAPGDGSLSVYPLQCVSMLLLHRMQGAIGFIFHKQYEWSWVPMVPPHVNQLRALSILGHDTKKPQIWDHV